jgi:glutaredoxin-related protein
MRIDACSDNIVTIIGNMRMHMFIYVATYMRNDFLCIFSRTISKTINTLYRRKRDSIYILRSDDYSVGIVSFGPWHSIFK